MSLLRITSTRIVIAAVVLTLSSSGVTTLGGGPWTQASAGTTTARAQQFGLALGARTPAGVTLADQVPGIAATGAGWVRVGFGWGGIEPSRGEFSWASTDDTVTRLRRAGLDILGVLAYTPAWASDPACASRYGGRCAPTDPADFASFAAAVAERYDGDGVDDAPGSPVVRAWEIWNEPNLASFWRPSPDAAGYTLLLRQAYSAIHAAAPSATVVSGGLSPAGGSYAPTRFLAAMYADGAAGSFDALGFHPYSYPASPTRVASWNAWQQMFTAFPSVGQPYSLRSLMVANGDGAKKIWATEYGAPTGGDTNGDGVSRCDDDGVVLAGEDQCVTERRQARLLTDAYTQWLGYRWAGPLFWYSYQDVATGSADVEDNFGLLHSDGTAKPALRAYLAAVQGSRPDRTAPSVPAGVVARGRRTSVVLRWRRSTDAHGVVGYRVYRNGRFVRQVRGARLVDRRLRAGRRYVYRIAAVDAAGNVSHRSPAVRVRTRR